MDNQLCKFCQRTTHNNKRVCNPCIEEHRPKLNIVLLIFLGFLGLVPAIIYYFWMKDKQETWDRENL